MIRSLLGRCASLLLCLGLLGCLPLSEQLCQDNGSHRPASAPAAGPHVDLLLTPRDVLKLALGASGTGDALEQEARDQKDGCLGCPGGHKRSRLQAELQAHAADEIHNQTVSLALTAYYRLAETRAQLDLLRKGIEPLQKLLGQARELKAQGLPLPADFVSLTQQRSKADSEIVKLSLLRDRLQEQLHQLLGKALCLPPCSSSTITTVEVFHVQDLALDECHEVELGLKYRPDLNLIRAALCNLDVGTLPVIRQVMLGVNSLLSGPPKRCIPFLECVPLLLPGLSAKEVEKVRKQLLALLDERKRTAVSEIRQALRAIAAQQQLIALAHTRQGTAQGQVAEAREKARQKLAQPTDLPLAQRDLFKAKSDLLHEVIEWELARVNLRKAQGLLVRDAFEAKRADGPAQGSCRPAGSPAGAADAGIP